MKKRVMSLVLTVLVCVSLAPYVLAADTPPELSVTWIKTKARVQSYNREANLLTVEYDDKYFVIDAKTGKKISEDYVSVGRFSEGLATVGKGDADGNMKYGYIDKTGKVVIPLEYDEASAFSEGLACVMKVDADGNRKYGYIDKTGNVVIPMKYWLADSFSEGLAEVKESESSPYQYIDKKGSVVFTLSSEYLHGGSFSEGLAVASLKKGGNVYIGYNGAEEISAREYGGAGDFSDGLALVTKNDADGNYKHGYIDTMGKLVIPLEYEGSINLDFHDGLAMAYKRDADSNFLINKTGAEVLDVGRFGANYLGDGLWSFRDPDNHPGEVGFFVSPYSDWKGADLGELLKGVKTVGAFPIVPVVCGVSAAALVVCVLVLRRVQEKKKDPEGYARKQQEKQERKAAAQAAKEAAQTAKATERAAADATAQAKKRAAAVMQGNVTCSCGTVNPASAKFCSGCGKPVMVPGRCPSCGHQNDPEAKFCQGCGKPLDGGEG